MEILLVATVIGIKDDLLGGLFHLDKGPLQVLEPALSFLGLGISAPSASWGTLAEEGWKALRSYPWLIILPGVFIATTVMCFNFVGDGFRDAIDPRTKETK